MPCGKRLSYTWLLLSWALGLLAGCTEGELSPRDDTWVGVCIDRDGDGYGFQCSLGPDCDDQDPAYGAECPRCTRPDEGCECEEGAAPVDCTVSQELTAQGALLCKVGTRFCRDGSWSACEGVMEFKAPPRSTLLTRAAIDPDALHPICDVCDPDCYEVVDELLDGGAPGTPVGDPDASIVVKEGGGITLWREPEIDFDAGPPIPDLLGQVQCLPLIDQDCDGIPDEVDPFPSAPPFPTEHRTIFMELAPGQEGVQAFDLKFYVNAADVYFYLDMTASMESARDNLIDSLTSGNYLTDTSITCADRNFNGQVDPDEEALKTKGIAGNIACLIRNAQLGAGWFRDIPFYGPYKNTSIAVAPVDFVMYENRQDITADAEAVLAALSDFVTDGNHNQPEGSMQGLWAIATGEELYTGWDRPGVPARLGCPAGTWGYPCFRDAATPIVIHITDSPLQNGPTPAAGNLGSSHPVNYDSTVLSGVKATPNPTYLPLTASAESIATAQDVGTLTSDTLFTYYGDTSKMTADHTYRGAGTAVGSCWEEYCVRRQNKKCVETGNRTYDGAWLDSSTAANATYKPNDAVFKFTVASKATYTISTRGSHFDTALMIVNAADATETWCNDNVDSDLTASEITAEFAAGTYYAIVKGRGQVLTKSSGWTTVTDPEGTRNAINGIFQITFGNTTKATSTSFAAKKWDGAGGIKEALEARKIRVISVNTDTNTNLVDQTKQIALATGAVDSQGKALVKGISSNGTGMGKNIVEAVELLAGNLAMDVSVRLNQFPDRPPVPFIFRVEAEQTPGNGCQAPVDRDGDPQHLPDTHVKCRPGAVPQFRVTFGNPSDTPVPRSNTPQGGYNMSLQIIGDNQYLISEVPVYIVPLERVVPPPQPKYAPSGSYEEIITVNGCLPGESAIWRSLNWSATIPTGTRVLWQMCGGTTDAALKSCTLKDVAEITTGATACTMDSQCPGGYCSGGLCHTAVGPACEDDGDCGRGGVCSVGGRCQWTTRGEADLYPVAQTHGLQGRPKARVKVTLFSDADQYQAPSIEAWDVKYRCAPQE